MIFQITRDDIADLNDADLRILLGLLAEEELRKAGHSPSAVTYGGDQRAADGGIDARVEIEGSPEITGFVPRANTGFQVKAEDMPRGKVIAEMAPEGVLRESIIELGRVGGAYIIVSSKGSLADTALTDRKNAMGEAIVGVEDAQTLHLDFYDRQRTATWVNQNPGLIPWVRSKIGKPLSGWRAYEDWSSSPDEPDAEYLLDDQVRLMGVRLKENDGLSATDGINYIRGLLGKSGGVVRMVGLSGVGKTRMVQALFDNRIGENALSPQLAVYADLGDEPNPVPLELLQQLIAQKRECVLIVDNCGTELHRKLTAQLKGATCPISLISIEYDLQEDEPENTNVFKLEAVSSEIIKRILERKFPTLNGPDIQTIAAFSDGNARVAIALGGTAKAGESLANLHDADLFKRLFCQRNQDNPELLKAAMVCSLVYSFDVDALEGDSAELPILAVLAEQSVTQLHANVAELLRRQLVQSRSKWRAVLPHALAHKLAKQALQDIPLAILKRDLLNKAPARMLRSLSRRIGFLHDLPEAQRFVEVLLTDDHWLLNVCHLNDLGATMLDNVAPVNPVAVLDSIERDVAACRAEGTDILNRQRLVSLLRAIAYEQAHFERAAMLIAELAEPGDAQNNMSEPHAVFVSLFFLYLSGTHASVAQRVAVLKQILGQRTDHATDLFNKGLSNMLEASHFSSSFSFEFGARARDYGYRPRTNADVANWFTTVFELCAELVASGHPSSDDIKRKIATRFRWIAEHTGCLDELIALSEGFQEAGGWPQGWSGVRSAIRSAKKAKQLEAVAKLEPLAELLKPQSLQTLIAAYVFPREGSFLDLAEIDIDDSEKYEKARCQVNEVCEDIGQQLSADPDALATIAPDLIQSKSERILTVAESMGASCKDPKAFWYHLKRLFLEHGANCPCGMLSGFLKGVAAVDADAADDLLDDVLASEDLHPHFMQIVCNVGISEHGYDRIIRAIELESVPTETLGYIGLYRATNELSIEQLQAIIEAVKARDDGLSVAFRIFHQRFVLWAKREDEPIENDAKQIGRSLLSDFVFDRGNNRSGYELKQCAAACLTDRDDEGLVRVMLRRIVDALRECRVYERHYSEFVQLVAERYQEALLDEFVERLAESECRRDIWSEFRDNKPCPTQKMDTARVISWLARRPDTRFVFLAKSARLWIKPDKDSDLVWSPIAEYLIEHAPDKSVLMNVIARRMRPTSWSGSLAHKLSQKIPLLNDLIARQDEDLVAQAKAQLAELEKTIVAKRKCEADRDRERDERFDW